MEMKSGISTRIDSGTVFWDPWCSERPSTAPHCCSLCTPEPLVRPPAIQFAFAPHFQLSEIRYSRKYSIIQQQKICHTTCSCQSMGVPRRSYLSGGDGGPKG